MSRWIEQLADYGSSPRTLRIISVVLTGLLLALALLQYHWIGQLSEAKKSEMEQALRSSAARFSLEFNREIGRTYGALVMGRPWSDGDSPDRYIERYRQWSTTATHHKLVKHYYLTKGDELQVLDPDTFEFSPAAWPAEWKDVREEMQRLAERYAAGMAMRARGERGERGERGPERGPGGGGPGGGRMFGGAFEGLPLLVSFRFERNAEGEPRPAGFAIAELDLDYIENELLPEMAQRHFADNYQILITNRADASKVIYSKGDAKAFASPDYEAGLFEIMPQEMNRGGGRRFTRQAAGVGTGGAPPPPPSGAGPDGGGGGQTGRWTLQLKHTAGSLDRAVQSLRYKNLGISFAILLLMGLTIGVFVDSTRRAQQLALQQMEFVASISHELRTPLTVICSAGDNLAGGVVKNDTQVKRYGNLVRSEGRRLADMVEQILGYAGIQKGRLPAPQPVQVESIINSALRACTQLLDSNGCTVERDISDDLPMVSGDAASLSHCIQNLVTNAAKYGGDWVRISAQPVGEKRVSITVEDHGPGIEPKELRHIFEPFYRGRKAVDDQIHGTGLGLSLVKRIVEAHSGRVSVESTIGQGTRFTLELPAMARAPQESPATIERNNEATSTLG